MNTNLQLGLFEQNVSVMRLLPPEIAFRYHALPIATDGHKITVAMPESTDQQASKSIQQFLNAPVCFIQADRLEIDRRLNKLWPTKNPPIQLLAWVSGEESDAFISYVKNIADLLDAELVLARIPLCCNYSQNLSVKIQLSRPDMFIYSSCHSSQMVKRLISSRISEHFDIACLKIPIEAAWPISKILLVLPELNGGTDLAISWAARLARSTQALVTVLPVLPPIPLCYGSFLRHNLEEILTGNDPLGQKMQEITSRFIDENVIGIYKMRDGDPLVQIRDEVLTSDPDIIIIPAQLGKGMKSWMTEDLGSILFKSSIKPLLTTVHIQ
jgi:nucleotide-binding universal stress UspA family protein